MVPPQVGDASNSTRRKHEVVLHYLEDVLDTLEPGEALPSERDLAQRFGVARMTVRQAMDRLVRTGQISRVQGAGSFRAQRRFEQPLLLTSFTEDMRARGLRPDSRVLSQSLQPAPPGVARRLNLEPSARVVRIDRLRLADEEPMAVERAFLVAARVPGLADRDLTGESLYTLLRTVYGVEVKLAEQTVHATLCVGDDAELLGVTEGAPALHLERTSSDEQGRLIEHVRSTYRGDRYELRMTLPLLQRPEARRGQR